MAHWYDKAVEELETDLDEGKISETEFRAQMRSLHDELKSGAEEAARETFNDHMGH